MSTLTPPSAKADSKAGKPAVIKHPPHEHKDPARSVGRDLTYYLMLVPIVVAFTFFITFPAVEGIFYSFTNFVGYGHWHFVGLANYKAAFSDPNIGHSYWFTMTFAVTTTIAVNLVSLILALALNSRIKWQKGFRVIFFLPMVISGLVISYVFNYLFSTSFPTLFHNLGVGAFDSSLLASPHAWMGVVFVSSWQSCPGTIIIYLAGLISIPTEVYEASSIDGATSRQTFWHVTLPLLFPFIIINSVLGLKNFLNVYDVVVGLTNGGPGTSTQSVAMTIFTGFTGGDYAYQMANAVLFFIVTLVLSMLQLLVIRRQGGSLA